MRGLRDNFVETVAIVSEGDCKGMGSRGKWPKTGLEGGMGAISVFW